MERNHRMELQYDGTGLHGWAKQDGLQTVEGCLEEAFRTVLGAGAAAAGGRADRRRRARPAPGGEPSAARRGRPGEAAPLAERPDSARHRRPRASARAGGVRRPQGRHQPHLPLLRVRRPGGVALLGALLLAGVRRRLDLGAHAARRPRLVVGRHHFTAFTPDRDRARLLRPHRAALSLEPGERGGLARGGARRQRSAGTRPGQAAACSAWRSKPTPFSATWCGLSWGPWSRSVGASGRWRTSRRLLDGAPREAAGLTAPAARALPLGHPVRPGRDEAAALWENPREVGDCI